jgi:hypothetical protein
VGKVVILKSSPNKRTHFLQEMYAVTYFNWLRKKTRR